MNYGVMYQYIQSQKVRGDLWNTHLRARLVLFWDRYSFVDHYAARLEICTPVKFHLYISSRSVLVVAFSPELEKGILFNACGGRYMDIYREGVDFRGAVSYIQDLWRLEV